MAQAWGNVGGESVTPFAQRQEDRKIPSRLFSSAILLSMLILHLRKLRLVECQAFGFCGVSQLRSDFLAEAGLVPRTSNWDGMISLCHTDSHRTSAFPGVRPPFSAQTGLGHTTVARTKQRGGSSEGFRVKDQRVVCGTGFKSGLHRLGRCSSPRGASVSPSGNGDSYTDLCWVQGRVRSWSWQ